MCIALHAPLKSPGPSNNNSVRIGFEVEEI